MQSHGYSRVPRRLGGAALCSLGVGKVASTCENNQEKGLLPGLKRTDGGACRWILVEAAGIGVE